MLQDSLLALRLLRKNPSFAILVITTLGLGIGANTAIFSVVHSILLRSLPYQQPEGLVHVWADNPSIHIGITELPPTNAEFYDWQARNHVFSALAGMDSGGTTIGGSEPERAGLAPVSANFFELFGIQPLLGRTINADDDQPGHGRVAVISYRLWQRRFSGDRDIVGHTIVLDDRNYTVIGVMPPGMNYPRQAELPKGYSTWSVTDVWTPFAHSPQERANRQSRNYLVLARLKPGVALATAQAEMSAIAAALAHEYPEFNQGWGVKLVPMQDQIVGRVKPVLLALLASVGLVLLIACGNVANLVLARATGRRREIAIRAALGAGRGRIVRQLLAESAMLALGGGIAGLVIAAWSVRALLAFGPTDIPRLTETSIDPVVLLFALGATLLTGLVFGLYPAFEASRVDLNRTLKQAGRANTTGSRRVRGALVVGEVALAVVMLAGAGLLLRSFARLLEVDPGFRAASVLTLNLETDRKYKTWAQVTDFYSRLTQHLAALPGVIAVGGTNRIPLAGSENMEFINVEGRPAPPPGQEEVSDHRVVTPDYFRAMGIPLISGRGFSDADNADSDRVAIVNQRFAERFFPGQEVIGRRLTEDAHNPKPVWLRIVGVVRDVKHSGLDASARIQYYEPLTQTRQHENGLNLAIRVSMADPMGIAQAVRGEIHALDPDLAISDVKPMREWVSQSLERRRFQTILIAGFAALALLLTVIGLYGVISYSVSQRTAEIGVRMALGAAAGDVARLVLKEGFLFVAAGLTVGLAGALAVTRLLAAQLYGVSARDPWTFAAVPLVLVIVAMAACWIPARRAMRVDPLVALRNE
jgi:putative ABC transport system permease protein